MAADVRVRRLATVTGEETGVLRGEDSETAMSRRAADAVGELVMTDVDDPQVHPLRPVLTSRDHAPDHGPSPGPDLEVPSPARAGADGPATGQRRLHDAAREITRGITGRGPGLPVTDLPLSRIAVRRRRSVGVILLPAVYLPTGIGVIAAPRARRVLLATLDLLAEAPVGALAAASGAPRPTLAAGDADMAGARRHGVGALSHAINRAHRALGGRVDAIRVAATVAAATLLPHLHLLPRVTNRLMHPTSKTDHPYPPAMTLRHLRQRRYVGLLRSSAPSIPRRWRATFLPNSQYNSAGRRADLERERELREEIKKMRSSKSGPANIAG